MTKADRRQPFTLQSLVLSRLTSSEIRGGCSVLGQVALDFFCSPPLIVIPSLLHTHLSPPHAI
jgi:hypothetical protein